MSAFLTEEQAIAGYKELWPKYLLAKHKGEVWGSADAERMRNCLDALSANATNALSFWVDQNNRLIDFMRAQDWLRLPKHAELW